MGRQFWLAVLFAAPLGLPAFAQVPPLGPSPGPAVDPVTMDPAAQPERAPKTMNPIPNDPEPAKHKPRPATQSMDLAKDDSGQELLKPPSHRCFVRDVMAFYDRTHVRCYNRARGKFNFFAVDTGQPVAETVLLKAWRSMRSGKPLTITYAPSRDLNPSNCDRTNCRRLLDIKN